MASDSQLHTPTPWHVSQSGADDYRILGPNPDAGKEHVSYSGDLLQVATTDSLEEAAYIVRAVNAHDALVEALREIAAVFWDDHEDCRYCDAPEGTPHDPDALCAKARTALALVRDGEV